MARRQGGIAMERALFVMVGMALFWQILRFRNVVEMLPYGSSGLLCFVVSLTAVVGVAALSPERFERWAMSRVAVWASALVASGALALQWAAQLSGWWGAESTASCVMGAMSGAAQALLLVAWYTRLARMESTDDWPVMAVLFGSEAIGLFAAMLLFSLSPVSGLFPVLVPLLAAVCWEASFRPRRTGGAAGWTGPDAPGSCGVSVPASLRRRLLNFGAPPSGMLLVLLAVLSLLGNLVLALSAGSAANQDEYTLWMKYLLSVLLIATAFVSLHRCENERKTSFVIGLLLTFSLVGGMGLLGSADSAARSLGIAVVTSCKTCIEVLVLFLLVRDAFDCRVAYGNFLVLFVLPVAVSFLAGHYIVPWALHVAVPLAEDQVAELSVGLSVFSLAVLAAVLAVVAIRSFSFEVTPDWVETLRDAQPAAGEPSPDLVPSRGGSTEGEGSTGPVDGLPEVRPGGARRLAAEDAGLPEEALERIALDYGLTARETQVFVYAFRGYSLQHIADLDVVSINTVKSHWKNLYRKLDVHTRQEFIDLAEARLGDEDGVVEK